MIATISTSSSPAQDAFDIIAQSVLALETIDRNREDISDLAMANDAAERASAANRLCTPLYRKVFGQNAEAALKALRAMPIEKRVQILTDNPSSIAPLAGEGIITQAVNGLAKAVGGLGATSLYNLVHARELNAVESLIEAEQNFDREHGMLHETFQTEVVRNNLTGLNSQTALTIVARLKSLVINHWNNMAAQLPDKPYIDGNEPMDQASLAKRIGAMHKIFRESATDGSKKLKGLQDYPIDNSYFNRVLQAAENHGLKDIATKLRSWHNSDVYVDLNAETKAPLIPQSMASRIGRAREK